MWRNWWFAYRYCLFFLDFVLHKKSRTAGEIEHGEKAVCDHKHHKYRQHWACSTVENRFIDAPKSCSCVHRMASREIMHARTQGCMLPTHPKWTCGSGSLQMPCRSLPTSWTSMSAQIHQMYGPPCIEFAQSAHLSSTTTLNILSRTFLYM